MIARCAGFLAAVVLAWPLAAQNGFQGPGQYQITNLKSGKVLDLDRNDQTTVIQFSSRGTDNQVWVIRPAADGYFFLRNGMNGYALDAGGGGKSEPVHGAPFNGGPSQQWQLQPGKDGNALIVSRLGRTLDIPEGSRRDGLRVQVYDLNGDSNQRFLLQRVSTLGRLDWDRDDGRDRDRGRNFDRGRQRSITCSSDSGTRVYCDADTRFGVDLARQISESPCISGQTWGYDDRGVWVDRGCRAEFSLRGDRGRDDDDRGDRDRNNVRGALAITCSSNHGERVYCETETRGRRVDLLRQISGSPCQYGDTWGYDDRGIWVDRGCRAEFAVSVER